ncbi:hypothetical protein OCV51_11025 [Faecalicatena acetigenes]|uniref:PIN domain-containing protein n=1 Tax=Faecalicatena acetigenes TaxID=2981790 RepID=A0ABT2TD16_9FIRM|nr:MULTISPECIES: hypothetical protein [Lachnospiraceae]MCU6748178.1 hypothetical protein [Faecalicatena acetigenes]SCI29945.1 Uncharacterised protein [uncultured Clostridium sp.]
MRVLIDTKVLISAELSTNVTPFQAYVKAAFYSNHGLICEAAGRVKTPDPLCLYLLNLIFVVLGIDRKVILC